MPRDVPRGMMTVILSCALEPLLQRYDEPTPHARFPDTSSSGFSAALGGGHDFAARYPDATHGDRVACLRAHQRSIAAWVARVVPVRAFAGVRHQGRGGAKSQDRR